MHSKRQVYSLNPDKNCLSQAADLAAKLYPNNSESVALMTKSSLNKQTAEDLKELIYIGEGARDKHGDYNIEEFIRNFIGQFNKQSLKLAKLAVKDIYLFGFISGRKEKKHKPVGQIIVDGLYSHGFENAVVHCIDYPNGSKKGDELLINITDQSMHNEPGLLMATLFSGGGSFQFILHADPMKEMNKPQHAFHANESKRHRADRLSKIKHSKKQHEAIHAIDSLQFLIAISQESNKKSRKKVVRSLKILATQLKQSDKKEWLHTLTKAQKLFSQYPSVANSKSIFGSEAKNLIVKLCADNQPVVKPIRQADPAPAPIQPQPPTHIIDELIPVSSSAPQEAEAVAGSTLIREESPTEDTQKLQQLKERVSAHTDKLKSERDKYSSGCITPFLFGFKTQTKNVKRNQLTELCNEESLPSFIAKAAELKSNKKVVSGIFSKRTADLLDEITQEQAHAPQNK